MLAWSLQMLIDGSDDSIKVQRNQRLYTAARKGKRSETHFQKNNREKKKRLAYLLNQALKKTINFNSRNKEGEKKKCHLTLLSHCASIYPCSAKINTCLNKLDFLFLFFYKYPGSKRLFPFVPPICSFTLKVANLANEEVLPLLGN